MDGQLDAGSGETPISERIGRVRWTICAMLFAATTINYMDRQVLSLLKPTLQASIGMTEVNYGFIVGMFTLAYALGLLGRRPVRRQSWHPHRLHGHHGRLEPLRHGPRTGQHSC